MKHLLEVEQLNKVYGKGDNQFRALKDISFTIQEGEFVGIMGPSGAGKSTLLHILATIDHATSGTITLNQKDIQTLKESELADFRRDHLGFIFQDYNLLDSLTVQENILLPLAIAKVTAAAIQERLDAILELLGIAALKDKYPYQISGGQKQRTAVARAIITKPSLIFADEPTGALDSKSATNLLNSLFQLNQKQDATIMMVTHDAFAASFCSRILIISDGELSHELLRGSQRRETFYQEILETIAQMGGEQK